VYKVLLCWRYLKTRYLALACIISVMLGVATLIVVNSVMSGFSTKLRDRLHGLLSDVLIEATSLDGFSDAEGKMAKIRKDPWLAEHIEAMTPSMEVWAMLQFRLPHGETITKPIRLLGVEIQGRTDIGGFKEHLEIQKDMASPSFAISELARRNYEWHINQLMRKQPKVFDSGEPPLDPTPVSTKVPRGVIVGKLIASFRIDSRDSDGKVQDVYLLHPGDQVTITTVSGAKLQPVCDSFLVVDYFASDMSEYDQNCVFVPLDYLQKLRAAEDYVTSIQIKIKKGSDCDEVARRLKALLPASNQYQVLTWEEKQSSLLAAIAIEKGILNVLLFLIIGVAGFGILAIFTMIVAEKTRDIGILKALGASNGGIMKIFLGYGALLGLIGTLTGTSLGVWLTVYINEVENGLSKITGQHIFNQKVYYFNEIPTDIQAWNIIWVDVGALLIAVTFSVLPALRAAMLHPVRALRYE
jgi:lipoprotein-releasing system permease protein